MHLLSHLYPFVATLCTALHVPGRFDDNQIAIQGASNPLETLLFDFSPEKTYWLAEIGLGETQNGLGGTETDPNHKQDSAPAKAFVLWHGLGDRYDSQYLGESAELIRSVIPGAFVHSVYLNQNPSTDAQMSILGYANDQVSFVCDQLANITELQNGFGAIGFSQGGLFLRAIIERCPNVTVTSLVTFGSPQMGVLELPLCADDKDWVCKRRNAFLKKQVWNSRVQKTIVPAQYFRDPVQYTKYLKSSMFLADLNNERAENFSAVARERFSALKKLVLIKFTQDTTLVPKESAFFEELDPLTNSIIPFNETKLYKDDLIGFKSLNDAKKVDFYTVDDKHMRFLKTFFTQIVESYFT